MAESEKDTGKDPRTLLPKNEFERLTDLLGREPNYVEATIFSIMWSEHCSYKSSREVLKLLPTEAPNVVLGPGEDAGAVHFTTHEGKEWCLVVAHESHNHPSQILPVEGAATGIGGIVRDVYCMGARVIAVMDPLRFGDPRGEYAERSKFIIGGVVDGIWGYGNPIGVPNMGGSCYLHKGYDDNCLVNVVAVGICPSDELIHSRVPAVACQVPYVFVLVGKATDDTGFGGASFASEILDEEEEFGAVQLHDPFLKRVLTVATYEVLKEARQRGIEVGFKDLGAGGIVCATSELGAKGGFGATIELDRVVCSIPDLPEEVIACSETQERYCWVVPQDFAPRVLEIYNEEFQLDSVYPGAGAVVIGRVSSEPVYEVTTREGTVCSVPIKAITEGISYTRERKARAGQYPRPDINFNRITVEEIKAVLAHPDVCSRQKIFSHYDSTVQGCTILGAGQADAGVMVPLPGSPMAVAMASGGIPRYGLMDSWLAGAWAVWEAAANVAAVGARPQAVTDCLNYGNPEDAEVFDSFVSGVEGIAWACREVGLIDHEGAPLPVISGNVSFYNESAGGEAVPASPIVACLGTMEARRVLTPQLKQSGSRLILIGAREGKLGGSVIYQLLADTLGDAPPDLKKHNLGGLIGAIVSAAEEGLLLSAHDISEGGALACALEMAMGYDGRGRLGVKLKLPSQVDLTPKAFFFSEEPGFVVEVEERNLSKLSKKAQEFQVEMVEIGEVVSKPQFSLSLRDGESSLTIELDELAESWLSGLEGVLL